jgi:hypothetical protein
MQCRGDLRRPPSANPVRRLDPMAVHAPCRSPLTTRHASENMHPSGRRGTQAGGRAGSRVASIRRWWNATGRGDYPDASRLLITADAGGSNGYRTRAYMHHGPDPGEMRERDPGELPERR